MNPVVSVIIPTYNRPGPLCELLECLSRQSFTELEVIVINDHGAPVDFIRELYPELRFKLLNMETNVQHVAARNAGLRAARGEYILLCDDDDLIVPSHIETMLAEIGAGYDLVYSDAEIVQFASEGLTRIPVKRMLFAYHYDCEAMRKFSTFVPSGCLYRKELHERIGYFDEEVYHYWDWDFFLRVSGRYPVKRVPVAGTLYSFASEGDNLSASLAGMEPYLDRLSAKHDLGRLPVKNFFLLLEEPDVKRREAPSRIVWDGQPVVSRLASAPGEVRQSG